MSKAVLISIRPKWVEKIANGEKTIEIRKNRPKLATPFKCYIYCSAGGDKLWIRDAAWRERWMGGPISFLVNAKKCGGMNIGNGKVIGEFTCERIALIAYDGGELSSTTNAAFSPATCLTQSEIIAYIGDKGRCYGWHISDLRIYDTPRELSGFTPACRYKNDDGSCPSRRVACSYQKYDYNPDGSINLVECGRTLERPPQSWCYVEEG